MTSVMNLKEIILITHTLPKDAKEINKNTE
jgi:hypothetical protein